MKQKKCVIVNETDVKLIRYKVFLFEKKVLEVNLNCGNFPTKHR